MTMSDPALRAPALRSSNPEMVPKALLRGMALLALSTLLITSYAVYTGRPPAAIPQASRMVQEKWIILEGRSAQSVIVRNTDGSVLLDLPHGGFITVIQSGVATERRKSGIDPLLPVRIVKYANGRLVAEDPETGWSAELYAFGGDNKAAFERLLATK
jgi:putative photosynthetic complex assembly protein